MMGLLSVLAVSFLVTYLFTPWFIRKLRDAGIVGGDMNKEGEPEVPEMGGLVVVTGFIAGVLLAIGLVTFKVSGVDFDLTAVLAGLSTILIMSLIGIIDDMFIMRQKIKAALPLFAALPLVAVNAGVTEMTIPVIGVVDFGMLFPLVLIPLAITGASNATNMLAGFNGLEAGLGIVMTATTGFIAYQVGSAEAVVLSFAMLGALLGFIRYNWTPAKILIGDVGTLSIGALVAAAVIIGNIEKVGMILIIPFFLELFLKMRSKFEAESWCDVRGDRLVCSKHDEVYGIGRLIMYLSGGVRENRLVLTILGVEAVFGVLAIVSMM